MARSLTVRHEEKTGTSLLLNAFLALAFGWLLLSTLAGAASIDAETAAPLPAAIAE